MRRATLAMLLCTSCNKLLGLDQTQPADAKVYDAPEPFVDLTYQLLSSTPADTITFPTIDNVTLHFGSLADPALTAVTAATGRFTLPYGATDHPYRVVYDVPGDPVHHEVQWQPATADAAHLTVPVFGRLPIAAPPAGCGYRYMLETPDSTWTCAPSPPCNLQPPITIGAAITGVWYQGTGGFKVSSDIAAFSPNINMQPLGGVPGTPAMANGDLGVVISFDSPAPPQRALGYAFASVDMMAGAFTQPQMQVPMKSLNNMGDPPNQTLFIPKFDPQKADPTTRIATALGPLVPTTTQIIAGVIPDAAMPSMTQPSTSGGFDDTVIIALASGSPEPPSTNTGNGKGYRFANPFTAGDQPAEQVRPPALLYRVFGSRSLGMAGPTLVGGLQEVTIADAGATNNVTLLDFGVPLPLLSTVTFRGDHLDTDGSQLSLPGAPFAELKFSLEAGPKASDCIVTLYAVDLVGGTLAAQRTILTPVTADEVTVQVPTSDLLAGTTYVFGIVCRNSFPGASTGDYTRVAAYPQSESQLYSGTFAIQ